MSPASPLSVEEALLSFALTANGETVDSSFQILSIDTWSAVNKLPRARIVIYDGSAPEQTFPISDLGTFLPGTAITISTGYDGSLTTIFSGIVMAHGVEIPRNAASTLVLDVVDTAVKMTVARKTAVFEKINDSDLISQLVSASGLSSDVDATTTVHEAVFQYDATDWDMMLLRAELNGLVVTTEAGKISVKAPDTAQAPPLIVTYGESIIDFHADMDARRQLPESAITSLAWDPETQQLFESGPGAVNVTESGNVTSATLAAVCGVSAFATPTGAYLVKDDLQSWSSAELLRARLAKICGSVRFQGSALAKPGTTLQIDGVGARFNGNVFVSAVHHDIRQGRWLTTVDFGLAADGFADRRSISVASAASQLAPIKGLHTGVVKQVAEDPAGGFRVLVSVPLAKDDSNGVWARLSSFYASNAFGAVFYPEVGDEVVVGFMNEDPRFPIILGSMYSKTRAPAFVPDNENHLKGIVTRSKMAVQFDETDKIITIKTPGGHVITLDDKAGAISLTDSNSNSVVLNKSGITVDSASNIQIKAKGNIDITAGGNLAMKATANATCEGLQVEMKAQTKFSAQGTASAELSASGMVTVQGALVKIN